MDKVYEIKEAVFEVIDNECFLQVKAETSGIFGISPEERGGATTELKEKRAVQMIIPRAKIGQIQPTFISQDYPELSSEKLVRATYGMTEDIEPEQRNLLLRQQLVRLFDSSLASPLAKSLLQRSGLIDSLRVGYTPSDIESKEAADQSGTLLDVFTGTKYTAEKYLARDLLLGYSLTLDQVQKKLDLRHEIELAYRWQGNIFIRGIYELESKDSARKTERRIMVEPHWRFGWTEEEK